MYLQKKTWRGGMEEQQKEEQGVSAAARLIAGLVVLAGEDLKRRGRAQARGVAAMEEDGGRPGPPQPTNCSPGTHTAHPHPPPP